jgi:hypothetical protein
MKHVMRILKGKDLEPDYFVVTPQQPTGVLLAHNIDQVEAIDDGKWIEISTEDGLKHLVRPDDRVLVVF